jgi:hypothetical protein
MAASTKFTSSEGKKLDQLQNEDPCEDAHVELQHVTLQHVYVQPSESNFHQELLDSPTTPAYFRVKAPLLVPPRNISTVTKDEHLLVLTRSWRTNNSAACFPVCCFLCIAITSGMAAILTTLMAILICINWLTLWLIFVFGGTASFSIMLLLPFSTTLC